MGSFLLAWRSVCASRFRTALLAFSLAIIFWLPIAATLLFSRFERELTSRAEETPVVIGAKGSRFDLLLHALYFRAAPAEGLKMGEASAIEKSGLARVIPLHYRFTARKFPVIGTSIEYHKFRRHRLAAGEFPQRLGDCVLGADVATELQLGAGDRILSDATNVFNVSGAHPLRMRITGVLAKTDSADDRVVFTDVETTWILEGIGHGHEKVAPGEAPRIYREVTDENVDSFHFHGRRKSFPLTAIIALPKDEKSETILLSRYLEPDRAEQAIEPDIAVGELLGFLFRFKQAFDLAVVVIVIGTGGLVVLIIFLTLQLRKREAVTIFKLGGSRGVIAKVLGWELLIVLGFALLIGLLLAVVTAIWGLPMLKGLVFG